MSRRRATGARLAPPLGRGEGVDGDERTLSIVKPDAVARGPAVRSCGASKKQGCGSSRSRRCELDQADRGASTRSRGAPFYASLVKFMTSGPIIVTVPRGWGAIAKNPRELMGPTDSQEAERGTIAATSALTSKNAVDGVRWTGHREAGDRGSLQRRVEIDRARRSASERNFACTSCLHRLLAFPGDSVRLGASKNERRTCPQMTRCALGCAFTRSARASSSMSPYVADNEPRLWLLNVSRR